MTTYLLSPEELVSTGFIHFLLHKHRELTEPISKWISQGQSSRSSESIQAFLKVVPEQVLKSVQEDYIRQGKPAYHRQPRAGADKSTSAMSQQPNRPAGQQGAFQPGQAAAATAAQQLRYSSATPPIGQQVHNSGNVWPKSTPIVQLQHGNMSQAQVQQAAVTTSAAGAQLNVLQQLQLQQQLFSRGMLPSGAMQVTPQQLQALFVQQQQQQQAQLLRAAQQQQAGQAGKRSGSAAPSTAAAGATSQSIAGKQPALASAGSAGNLPALVQQTSLQQQAAARLAPAPSITAAGNLGQRQLQTGGINMPGIRPGLSIPGAPGIMGIAPGSILGAGGISQQAAANIAAADARQHLAQLKPGEPPRVQLPDTHEWVQCLSKDGQPTWCALSKTSAARYRADQKRKADDAAGSQPAAKSAAGAGGAVRRRIDDDYTAGAGDRALDVMADDELQAEMAVNEAAKGAVQVQQGNVQEEYILNQGPTLQLIANTAKKNGVRQVSEDLYAFLSLAADAHLSQLLHKLVKSRLQREDLGKTYQGVEKQEDNVRGRLFQIQKREREAAREREEKERDELAKLSGSRKKLGDEDKKAAKAAQTQKQLEMQQKNLGNTLSKMGIGRRTFTMSALGKPAGATAAGARPGFTKPELVEAKAAAAAATPPAVNANGVAPVKSEPAGEPASSSQQQHQQPASGLQAAGVPPLMPVTLQHQLLTAANSLQGPTGGGPVSFVAGGATSGRLDKDGDNTREIMLKDLIAVLERHPIYCRSQLLYSLYALTGQHAAR